MLFNCVTHSTCSPTMRFIHGVINYKRCTWIPTTCNTLFIRSISNKLFPNCNRRKQYDTVCIFHTLSLYETGKTTEFNFFSCLMLCGVTAPSSVLPPLKERFGLITCGSAEYLQYILSCWNVFSEFLFRVVLHVNVQVPD